MTEQKCPKCGGKGVCSYGGDLGYTEPCISCGGAGRRMAINLDADPPLPYEVELVFRIAAPAHLTNVPSNRLAAEALKLLSDIKREYQKQEDMQHFKR